MIDLFGRKAKRELERQLFEAQQAILREGLEVKYLKDELAHYRSMLNNQRESIGYHNATLARLLAKLDPMFAQPELNNPARKAESDRIAKSVEKRLKAEQAIWNDPRTKPQES